MTACSVANAELSSDFYCTSLVRSKFMLHLRGDSFGSTHLWDALLHNVIPIFTHEE